MSQNACVFEGGAFGSKPEMSPGQRRDEVAEMRWNEIDFAAKTWTLPRARAKNDVEHGVPLSVEALQILEGLPRVSSKAGFVFTTNGETAVSGFARAKQRLDAELASAAPDMPPWVIHDLRRTFASGSARLGVNLPVIEEVLNHVSGSFRGIVGIYQRHSFADEKRAALDAWGGHVQNLVNQTR
jgi:integrase